MVSCDSGVTVTLHIKVLGFVLGYSIVCFEVDERGLIKGYTAAPTMNDDSRRINNR